VIFWRPEIFAGGIEAVGAKQFYNLPGKLPVLWVALAAVAN
jgi:hypothetical protein